MARAFIEVALPNGQFMTLDVDSVFLVAGVTERDVAHIPEEDKPNVHAAIRLRDLDSAIFTLTRYETIKELLVEAIIGASL